MKIRNGFVSNSSSSSFVIIGEKKHKIPKFHDAYWTEIKELHIPQTLGGETEWNYSTYSSFADKLNWAALMCYITEGPGSEKGSTEWTDMLLEIIEEDLGIEKVKINYVWEHDEYNHEVFLNPLAVQYTLDHGSHPCNSEESAKMFKDKETLRNFLFAPDSEIKIEYE